MTSSSRYDLTTLANVQAWLNLTSTTDNALIARLITNASRMIYAFLGRPMLASQSWTDALDGAGSGRFMLPRWPVTAVASLTIDGRSIPQLTLPLVPPPSTRGFALDPWDGTPPGKPQAISLYGVEAPHGRLNLSVTYQAGYLVAGEAQGVPNSSPYQITVSAPYGNWSADAGVSYANGTALVPVAASPAQGQYCVAAGVYGFAAADAGADVLIGYSYIPAEIENAAIEMVAERYRYRARIGESSHSLGGQETVTFSLKDIPDYLRLSLQPYRKVMGM